MTQKAPQAIGILGEGQLARMLIEGARSLGLEPKLFVATTDSPAARISQELSVGKIQETEKLRDFLKEIQYVAFENEFLDVALLRKAAEGLQVKYLPSLETLEKLQDKFSQKKIFESLSLPQAPYELIKNSEDENLKSILARYPSGFVLKWSRMGYDGKGVLIVSSPIPKPTKSAVLNKC